MMNNINIEISKEEYTPPNPLLIEGEFLPKKEKASPPLVRGGRGVCLALSFLLLFLLLSASCLAKKIYPIEDRQLWLSAEMDYEFAKDFSLDLSEELRYYKNRSVLAQSLTDIGLSYSMNSYLKVGLAYRLRIMPDEDEKRNETYLNLTLKPDLGRLDISNRIRLHLKFPKDKDNIYNLRDKLTIGYKVSSWLKPYIAAELFYRFLYADGDRLSQGRYYAGTKFNLPGSSELELFIMREQEYNTNKAENSNVVGLGYSIEF